MIAPLHSSLGDRARLCLKKKKEKKERKKEKRKRQRDRTLGNKHMKHSIGTGTDKKISKIIQTLQDICS